MVVQVIHGERYLTMTSKMLDKKRGFTLVEIVLVCTIVLILVTISAPFSSDYIDSRQMYTTAVRIQQDILLIKNSAITYSSSSERRFRIRFYPSKNYYLIEGSLDANLDSGTGTIIRRDLSPAVGFPYYFGMDAPLSVSLGESSSPPNSYMDLSFNNVGVPFQGSGYISIVNASKTKQIRITISVIGTVNITWIKE